MRRTSKNLENLLQVIVDCSPSYEDWEINYCSFYGGYQITSYNGSHIVKHRGTARETYAFLEGVLEVVGY